MRWGGLTGEKASEGWSVQTRVCLRRPLCCRFLEVEGRTREMLVWACPAVTYLVWTAAGQSWLWHCGDKALYSGMVEP